MRVRVVLCSLAGVLAMTPAAGAHVTLNPEEWEAGGFARFAVRVPNERDNATSTRLTIQFPESVVEASFMPAPGWKRTVKMARLAEPIEEEGEEPITERIASVTWSGGTIRPREFVEFGVSFQVPDTPGEDLLFPSLQTYSSGEIVRWIAPDPEADTPAPRIAVLPPEEEEEGAETAAGEAQAPASPGATEDDEARSRANLAVGLGVAGLVAGVAALGLALFRRRPA
jgi:periplasmic copper chaperone A